MKGNRRIIGAAVATAVLAVAGSLVPLAAQQTATTPERTDPPPPLEMEPLEFPPFVERTLSNGASVIVVENHEQPFASIELRIGTGSAADPEGMTGLASMVATLLTRGTTTRSSDQIATAIDFVGGNLGVGAGPDWISVSAASPTVFLDTALVLLADVVQNPTFPESELETERRRTLSGLQVSLSQPGTLASRRFFQEVYGDHPYGAAPDPETVRALGQPHLVAFHERYFRPDEALFVVAGDVRPDEIVDRLERHFGDWSGSAESAPPAAEPPARTTRTLHFVHKPGLVQATVRVGHLLPAASWGDWVTLDVANQVLGGGTTGWLFRILRNEKGYTYGSYSSTVEREQPGFFMATAEVRNEVADSAMAELLSLISRLRDEPVPVDDLEKARSFLAGSFPRSIETPQQVAGQVATSRLLGRSSDYLERYRHRVVAVTPESLQQVAREQLHPDRAVVVVVGDAGQILDRVTPFGDEVHLYDVEGKEIDAGSLVARAAEIAFDPGGLEPATYVYALNFQGQEVGEVTRTLTREESEAGPVFRSVETTGTPMGALEQVVVFDARTFEPRHVTMSGPPAAAPGVDLELRDGRVVGTIQMPNADPVDVDQEVPAGSLFPGMDGYALALAELAVGTEFELPQVSVATGAVSPLRVKVVGETTVEVPAGSFEVFEVTLGGEQTTTVYVTRQAPHVMVKQVPAAQPMSVELKEIR